MLDPKARVGSSAPQHQRWTVGVTRWRDALPYEVTGSQVIRLVSGFRQGLTCGPSASGSTFPRPRPPQLGGAHQPGRASPRRASPALHQVPLQSRSPGQVPGSPTSHFPWVPSLGKSPTHRQAAGWRDGEPLAVNPTRVWGVGPRATLARATDNTTHGLAIPARSVAHSLSPPHRATQRLSLLGDPSTHPTGGQGHREAGRQATGQAGPAQTMSLTHRGERGEERG